MYRFLMSKRYANLLFLVRKDLNIHQLSKEADMTTSHLSNVTDQWHREGIIIKKRVGREINIKITKKGEKLIEIVRQYEELSKTTSKEIKEGEKKNERKN